MRLPPGFRHYRELTEHLQPGGATACGWYLTLGLRNDPHGFEIEIPRGFDEKSFCEYLNPSWTTVYMD
mgnify:FL=1|jgi:hypothetical protein